jgi:hypothetical protein
MLAPITNRRQREPVTTEQMARIANPRHHENYISGKKHSQL